MLAAFWISFIAIIGPLVVKLLKYLGLTIVVYTGVDTFLAFVMTQVQSNISGLPADAVSLLALFGIDEAITISVSAVTSAFSIRAANKAIA